jgi:hypothetical protein
MNIKVEGGEKEIQFFAKAKSMPTAVSNFWNARTDAGMTPSLKIRLMGVLLVNTLLIRICAVFSFVFAILLNLTSN